MIHEESLFSSGALSLISGCIWVAALKHAKA